MLLESPCTSQGYGERCRRTDPDPQPKGSSDAPAKILQSQPIGGGAERQRAAMAQTAITCSPALSTQPWWNTAIPVDVAANHNAEIKFSAQGL